VDPGGMRPWGVGGQVYLLSPTNNFHPKNIASSLFL
jgi:hypothetical protein